jgi:hypothetical protein
MANQYDKPCNKDVLGRSQRYKADKPKMYLAGQERYRKVCWADKTKALSKLAD